MLTLTGLGDEAVKESISRMRTAFSYCGFFYEKVRGKVPASVLLVGVVSLQGDFEKGDLVTIADESGRKIAIGRSDYSSKEALPLLGEHNVKPLVHYNYLSLEN